MYSFHQNVDVVWQDGCCLVGWTGLVDDGVGDFDVQCEILAGQAQIEVGGRLASWFFF